MNLSFNRGQNYALRAVAGYLDIGSPTHQAIKKEILTLRTRLAELEKVVEKLPVTADGVVVTPGMRYWFEYEDCPGEFGDDLASYIEHDGREDPQDFSDLYSTREAALAARNPAEQEGGG